MKSWQAIGLTVLIVGVCMFLPPQVMFLVMAGTSIWAAVDSASIGLHRYKSGIAMKPFTLFLGCALLWIVAFPWYLSVRYRILNGQAQLKDGSGGEAVAG